METGSADANHFLGGTSEGCPDTGIYIQNYNRNNIFSDFGLEVNGLNNSVPDVSTYGGGDVIDNGMGTIIEGGYFAGVIKVGNLSELFTVRDTMGQRVEVSANAKGVTISDVRLNRSATNPYVGGIITSSRSISTKNVWDIVNNKVIKAGVVVQRALNTSSTYTITPYNDVESYEVVPTATTTIYIDVTNYTNIGCILKFKNNGNFPVNIRGVEGVTINGLVGTAITLEKVGDYAEIVLSTVLNAWRTTHVNLTFATANETAVGTITNRPVNPAGVKKALDSYAPFIVYNRIAGMTITPSYRGIAVITKSASEITHVLDVDVPGEGLIGQVIELSNMGTANVNITLNSGVTVDGQNTNLVILPNKYIKLIRSASNTWLTIVKT